MSASFKDDLGREWNLRLDFSLVRSIRDSLGVDLLSLEQQGNALTRMADDPALLVDVVYLICEKQCQRRKISDEEFGHGFTGETFQTAAAAFMEALVSFTPPPRRDLAKFAMTMTTGAMEAATETAKQILQKTLDEAQEQLATCGK
jgi:hypothetical protein